MCVYLRPAAGSAAYYYRIGKGENLSELNERKRFVFRFSYSLPFRIHTHTQLIIRKRGPLLASVGRHSMIFIEDLARASSPCRLGTFSFADGEQVSHLSTCQKEKLIILYVHVLAPRTTLILQGGKWPTIALAYGQFRLVCLLALTAGYFFLMLCSVQQRRYDASTCTAPDLSIR